MRQSQNNRINPDPRADLPRTPTDRYGQADNRTSRKKTPFALYIGAGLVMILILITVVAALSKPFKHQLELSIVRQPAPYTQLYFSRPGALPGQLKVDERNTFDFTIVNDESRAYRYTYTLTLDDSKTRLVVGTETVSIDNGSSATRAVTVVPKDRKSKYEISITLQGMNQSIHFYGQTS